MVRGAVQQTKDFPQLLLIFQVVDFPVVVQRPIPMVLAVQQTIETLQLLLNTVIGVPVAQVVQDIPVVMQKLIPMVSLTIEIPPVLLRQGDRCPAFASGASSTGAVVEQTVVLPRLHSLRNSLRSDP